ncbi:hypothetical protein C8N29_106119 [Agitococcus lubricus]|uniref:Uncharacterized protein n=1 Tax=Agitococcus lubricus TaxID=1077255 RepID=A0A2T5IZU6_9GAMM|nr:hypothetical protein C8N29_106119 [Agitococcus lubricus]
MIYLHKIKMLDKNKKDKCPAFKSIKNSAILNKEQRYKSPKNSSLPLT